MVSTNFFKLWKNCNDLGERTIFIHDWFNLSEETSKNTRLSFEFRKIFSLLIRDSFNLFYLSRCILNKFSHQKSLLKESIKHELMIWCPTTQWLELSVHMIRVALHFFEHFSLKRDTTIEFREEDKFNFIIKFNVRTCFLS